MNLLDRNMNFNENRNEERVRQYTSGMRCKSEKIIIEMKCKSEKIIIEIRCKSEKIIIEMK
jgi:hypothetical protein